MYMRLDELGYEHYRDLIKDFIGVCVALSAITSIECCVYGFPDECDIANKIKKIYEEKENEQ